MEVEIREAVKIASKIEIATKEKGREVHQYSIFMMRNYLRLCVTQPSLLYVLSSKAKAIKTMI